jgi:hypothetical protein
MTSNPSERKLKFLSAISLVAAAWMTWPTVGEGAEREQTVQLPAVTVGAQVPLVKVGELKMQERRFAPAAVAHGQHIYIIGGLNHDGVMSATVERFDVRTGSSEVFARLRIPRFWHSAVLVGEKVYVLGGSVVGPPLPSNPETAEARLKARGPDPHLSSPIPFVEIIDLKTRRVMHGPRLPRAAASFGCVVAGEQIATVGGKVAPNGGATSMSDRLSVYDPDRNAWMLAPPMPTARETAAVLTGPYLIVAGGFTGVVATKKVEVHDLRSGKWRTAAPLGRVTSAHSMVSLGSTLFLFGDYSRPEELLVYDLEKETSETFTLGYTPARHTAAVTIDRRIYVIGGRMERQSEPLDLIQVFALTKEVAAAAGKMP